MGKKMRVLILIVILLTLGFVIWEIYSPKRLVEPKSVFEEASSPAMINAQTSFSAWIPWWDEKRILESLEKRAIFKVEEILPLWFGLNKNGVIDEREVIAKVEIENLAKINNVVIIPTITNDFDPKRVTKFINSSTLQDSEIEKLITIAVERGYGGYDLDWEEISEKDKKVFVKFVSKFKQKLSAQNLKLSVTVHAQTGTSADWVGVRGQDIKELGKIADYIRVMAYDFHHSKSEPGPVTPLDKLKAVLNYTVKNVDKDKIVLGLPSYGYDWSEKNEGESIQYLDAIERFEKYAGQYKRDSDSGALWGNYQKDNKSHTVWFEDKESTERKIEISQEFGVNRFCFWRIGGEDEKMWEIN